MTMKTTVTSRIITYVLILCGFSLSILGQSKAKINVLVTDFNNSPIGGEQIEFVNRINHEKTKAISSSNGSFSVELVGGFVYDIMIKSVGEALEYNSIEIPKIAENEMYGENSMQIMIEKPKSYTLNNVFFDTGKSTIKPSSNKELDELVELLKLKPEMKIEISGHTDNVGNENDNLILSENRAKAVMNYLTSKGIPSNRLTYKGYGSSKPISDNNSEQGRKLNRRTEILLLS